jgi:hypothetical protein
VKYPLTDKTKAVARLWASEWESGQMEDNFGLIPMKGDGGFLGYMSLAGGPSTVAGLTLGSLRDLHKHGFISMHEDARGTLEISLSQSLCVAVDSDFEMPPTTPHIVAGVNVQGNAHVGPGGILAGSAYGDVNINSSISLADKIEELMGDDVRTIAGLEDAIHEVRQATEPKARWQTLAKVSSLIGGGLSNLAKVEGATKAMIMIAEAIARLASAG